MTYNIKGSESLIADLLEDLLVTGRIYFYGNSCDISGTGFFNGVLNSFYVGKIMPSITIQYFIYFESY